MSMSGLLILAEHVYDAKDILHKHILSREEIARESPTLSMPSVIGVRAPSGA